jgi:LEA14-like dessication related protein
MEALKTRHAAAGLCLLLGVVGLLSCATVDLEPPSLTLVDLRPSEATLFETTLSVKLRISNPNPEPLTLEGGSFKLTLDGRKIGRGLTAETVTVDRLGSEIIEATFHISNASLLLRLRELLEVQTVTYAVTGKLYTRQSGRTRNLKVQSSGRLDLSSSGTAPATQR